MSIRDDETHFKWLELRQHNVTASKIAPIVKEYSEDPYWSTIDCYSDSFSVYCESLMSGEALFQRSKEGEAYYNRLGNFIEPYIFNEFLKSLDIDSYVKEENIIYNVHTNIPDKKIACTPDYIIKDLESSAMEIFTKLEVLNSKSFSYVKDSNFDHSVENTFLLECKSKSLAQVLKEYKRDSEGNLVPPDYIILQLQTQMLVTQIKWGVIGTLIFTDHGVKFHFYFMNACPKIHNIILTSVEKYHESIEKGDLPFPQAQKDYNFNYVEFDTDNNEEFLTLNFREAKEFDLDIHSIPSKKREILLDLLSSYKSHSKQLERASNEIDKVRRALYYDDLENLVKHAKSQLDKYFQVLFKTKGEYIVRMKEENMLYSIIVTKEQDWVCKKTKVTRPGDVYKKGERSLSVMVEDLEKPF